MKKMKNPKVKREKLILELASMLHNQWRKPRWDKRSKKYKPRIKPTNDKAWIKKHSNQNEVDIANTKFSQLPSDWQAENIVSAQHALEKIEESLCLVHDKWLDRNNKWVKPGLEKKYSKLAAREREKDMRILKKAIELLHKYNK